VCIAWLKSRVVGRNTQIRDNHLLDAPSKLLGESSEVNVGVFIKRVGWALDGIPFRTTFNLVKDPHRDVDALRRVTALISHNLIGKYNDTLIEEL